MGSVTNVLVAIITALLSNILFSYFESRSKRAELDQTLRIVQYLGTFLALVVALLSGYKSGYIQRYVERVAEGDIGARLGGTVALLLAGALLYLLRERQRRLYALLELAIAAVTAYASLQNLAHWQQASAWVPIAGAVYLVVRGLDNLAQGIKAARKEATEVNTAAPGAGPT